MFGSVPSQYSVVLSSTTGSEEVSMKERTSPTAPPQENLLVVEFHNSLSVAALHSVRPPPLMPSLESLERVSVLLIIMVPVPLWEKVMLSLVSWVEIVAPAPPL